MLWTQAKNYQALKKEGKRKINKIDDKTIVGPKCMGSSKKKKRKINNNKSS